MKTLLMLVAGLVIVAFGGFTFMIFVGDPMVARELLAEPDGERAGKVMLLGLPSGRLLPVNYLREGEMVYAAADGWWWEELRGDGGAVSALIRGEKLRGRGRAIEDDPDHTKDVFRRLRPISYRWLGGVLVEIRLDAAVVEGEE